MGDVYAKKFYPIYVIVLLMMVFIIGNNPLHAAKRLAGGMRGIVYSDANTPLDNVAVKFQRSGGKHSSMVRTAHSGSFDSGFLLPGDYIVTFQHAGYRTVIYRHLSIPEGRFVRLKVYLDPKIQTEKGTGALEERAVESEDQEAAPCEAVIDAAIVSFLAVSLSGGMWTKTIPIEITCDSIGGMILSLQLPA